MRSFQIFVVAVGLALTALGCAKTTENPGLGTNTNWMRTCDAPSDCGEGDLCVCGVCTRACTSSSSCGAVHAAASCEVVSEAACGVESAIGRACFQSCETEGDCTAVEGAYCVAGLCVPAAEPPMLDARVIEPPIDADVLEPAKDASVVEPVNDAGIVSDPLALTRLSGAIQIPETYTACSEHLDCRVVSTSCDGCCQNGAINRSLQDAYGERLEPACADYDGLSCTCELPDDVARCEQGRCTVVPRAAFTCYGPELNEHLAYEPEAVGCNCNELRDKSICTGATALICTWDGGGTAWVAVEDGPCGEPSPDPTCAEGELRPTATDCLNDFGRCWRVPNGEYCGVIVTVDP